MRGTRAKQLRRNAAIMAGTAPMCRYSLPSPPRFINHPVKGLVQYVKVQRGTPTVLLQCERLIYKVLKRLYKLDGGGV